MARSASEILEQLQRQLPGHYSGMVPMLAGFAVALAAAEAAGASLAPLATVGGGTGKWLTLQARGYGIQRATSEGDEGLRTRLRNVEDSVTVPAIKAAVDALIAPDECTIIEWWEGPYLDSTSEVGLWLDNDSARLSGGPRSFLVLIPRQSTGFDFGAFLDDLGPDGLWLDASYIGEGPEDPIYEAIVNEVERMRAAGFFWRLVLEG